MSAMDPERYLLSLLSRRPYTREELKIKLKTRECCNDEEIESLLDLYENYGYIDDPAYAKLYLASHEQWGKLKLRDRMMNKGLDRDVIYTAFEESGFDEVERAEKVILEMFQNGLPVKKIYSRLLSRGFSSSSVHEGIKRALNPFEQY